MRRRVPCVCLRDVPDQALQEQQEIAVVSTLSRLPKEIVDEWSGMRYGAHCVSPFLVSLSIGLIPKRFAENEIVERISCESNEHCVHVPKLVLRVLSLNVIAQYFYLLIDEFLRDIYCAFREENTVCGASLSIYIVGNRTKC
jgi:hypothetical protein